MFVSLPGPFDFLIFLSVASEKVLVDPAGLRTKLLSYVSLVIKGCAANNRVIKRGGTDQSSVVECDNSQLTFV